MRCRQLADKGSRGAATSSPNGSRIQANVGLARAAGRRMTRQRSGVRLLSKAWNCSQRSLCVRLPAVSGTLSQRNEVLSSPVRLLALRGAVVDVLAGAAPLRCLGAALSAVLCALLVGHVVRLLCSKKLRGRLRSGSAAHFISPRRRSKGCRMLHLLLTWAYGRSEGAFDRASKRMK